MDHYNFRFNTRSDHRFGVVGICIDICMCGLTLCGDWRSSISGIHRRHTTFLYRCWFGKNAKYDVGVKFKCTGTSYHFPLLLGIFLIA